MNNIPKEIKTLLVLFFLSLFLVAVSIVLLIFKPTRTAGVVLGIVSLVSGVVFIVMMIIRLLKTEKGQQDK